MAKRHAAFSMHAAVMHCRIKVEEDFGNDVRRVGGIKDSEDLRYGSPRVSAMVDSGYLSEREA